MDTVIFDNNVRYFPSAIDKDLADWYYNELNEQVEWHEIKWSTGRTLPRLCCHDIESTEIGSIIKDWLEQFFLTKLGVNCLIINIFGNKYRNGNDWLPDHKDEYKLPEYLAQQLNLNDEKDMHVVSISFGASRSFHFKQNNRIVKPKFNLSNGDLIMFSPKQNKDYKHGIQKQPSVTEARINLTCFCIFLGTNNPYTTPYL